ncbi:MAG: alpha-1,2-fucosyltransferase [Chitinophagaceae bacterium]|nr:alpha-1,2-fucosyltransferase [Chitinophagaceae bacterium]
MTKKKPVVIVKIFGGLGNQMFQYAAGKSLAVTTGAELLLDISSFTNQPPSETPRQWALHIFKNIDEGFCDLQTLRKMGIITGNSFFSRVYKRLIKKLSWINNHYLLEKSTRYSPLGFKGEYIYLDGYWQSYKYFADQESLIKKQFDLGYLTHEATLKDTITNIRNSVSVGLHVRRGDYIAQNNAKQSHAVCTEAFYYTAINELKKLEQRDIKIFIFSDDIEWCKQHLVLNEAHTFITTGVDANDLYCMSICQHNIIANSTFSWWAAWLNNNPVKIVITPDTWHLNLLAKAEDRLPPNWIKINNESI